MDFETMMRDAVMGYARVPAMDRDRTEARMSASTGRAFWEQMIACSRIVLWPHGENALIWDASKLDGARLFGLRVRRDDSVPDGEVQYWTRR